MVETKSAQFSSTYVKLLTVSCMFKLAALHLDPKIIAWLHSYLMGRSQLVVVGGEQSTCLPVISGVPHAGLSVRPTPLYSIHQ